MFTDLLESCQSIEVRDRSLTSKPKSFFIYPAKKGETVKHSIRVSAVALIAIGLVATGCSSPSSSSSDADATIEYWSFTGVQATEKAAEFEKSHPEFKVKVTEVGSSAETAQAVTAALASGKVPDLVLIQDDDLPKLIQNPDIFVDLNTLGAEDIAGDFFDWAWANGTATNGAQVGVPTDTGGLTLAYRTDLFEAAGLPTDPDEVAALWPTWDDFIEVGKQYTEKTGKPFIDSASNTVFRPTIGQVTEQYYDAEGNAVYDTNPQVKEAFDTSIEASTAGISAKLGAFSDGWSAGTAEGAFAVMSAPGWMLGIIKANAPDTSGLWNVTTIPGVGGNWGGSHLLIPKGAKHPEAAWEYLKALQSPEGQLDLFLTHDNFPSSPEAIADPQLADKEDPFFSNGKTGQILGKSVAALTPFPLGPDTGAIGGEFANAITHVDVEGGDPDSAWKDALAAIKTSLGG